MKEFFKAWKWFSFPIVWLIFVFAFIGYNINKENLCKNNLIETGLEGNPYAISILVKYEKPWNLDERLVQEALKGNENAIKILGITTPRDQ